MFDPVTAIVASTAIKAGASILGSRAQAKAAKSASKAQSAAADRTAQVQWDMYDQTRQDMAPWRKAGGDALYKLSDIMGIPTEGRDKTAQFGTMTQPFDYQNWQDPGYDFRLGEGQKALERSAAKRGGLLSGRTGRELTRYAQNYGSAEYGNAFRRYQQEQNNLYNRLAGIANTGQVTAGQTGQFGAGAAGNVGNAYMAAGKAQAQGYNSAAQARASGYAGVGTAANQGIQNYLLMDYLKK